MFAAEPETEAASAAAAEAPTLTVAGTVLIPNEEPNPVRPTDDRGRKAGAGAARMLPRGVEAALRDENSAASAW